MKAVCLSAVNEIASEGCANLLKTPPMMIKSQ